MRLLEAVEVVFVVVALVGVAMVYAPAALVLGGVLGVVVVERELGKQGKGGEGG